jgi:hypothetical protein
MAFGRLASSGASTVWLYTTESVWVYLAYGGFIFSMTGANVVMTAVAGELFPTSSRSTAAGFRMSLASLGGAIGFYLEAVLFRGSHAEAVVMLVPALAIAAFGLFLLPESAGRELEDLTAVDPVS